MSYRYRTIQYDDYRRLSFSSIAIILVFFLVTSQVFILPLPSIVTKLFRPFLIVMFAINMQHSGTIHSSTRIFAFLLSIHALIALLFHLDLMNRENMSNGIAVSLYFMMFSFAIGVNWSRRDLEWIIRSCFFGCFVCAVALLVSNNPLDFNAATAGHLDLAGFSVNRNKNAYQYAFGSILGLIYLLKGKKNKGIVLLLEIVIGYAMLYSQCRGAFFSFVGGATILLIGLLIELRKNNNERVIVYVVSLLIFYIVSYYLLKNSELSRLVDGESTSGRDEGIKAAWKLFLYSDWFGKIFGNGFGYEFQQTQEIGAHFVYVGYLVSIGVIGSGLTAMTFVSALKHSFGAGAISLIITALLKTFFEGADYNVFIPMILGVVICNYTRVTGRKYYELFG